jgi:hypothetical protein
MTISINDDIIFEINDVVHDDFVDISDVNLIIEDLSLNDNDLHNNNKNIYKFIILIILYIISYYIIKKYILKKSTKSYNLLSFNSTSSNIKNEDEIMIWLLNLESIIQINDSNLLFSLSNSNFLSNFQCIVHAINNNICTYYKKKEDNNNYYYNEDIINMSIDNSKKSLERIDIILSRIFDIIENTFSNNKREKLNSVKIDERYDILEYLNHFNQLNKILLNTRSMIEEEEFLPADKNNQLFPIKSLFDAMHCDIKDRKKPELCEALALANEYGIGVNGNSYYRNEYNDAHNMLQALYKTEEIESELLIENSIKNDLLLMKKSFEQLQITSETSSSLQEVNSSSNNDNNNNNNNNNQLVNGSSNNGLTSVTPASIISQEEASNLVVLNNDHISLNNDPISLNTDPISFQVMINSQWLVASQTLKQNSSFEKLRRKELLKVQRLNDEKDARNQAKNTHFINENEQKKSILMLKIYNEQKSTISTQRKKLIEQLVDDLYKKYDISKLNQRNFDYYYGLLIVFLIIIFYIISSSRCSIKSDFVGWLTNHLT